MIDSAAMLRRLFCLGAVLALPAFPQKLSVPELLTLLKKPSASAEAPLRATFTAEEFQKGMAVAGQGEQFVWVAEAEKRPILYVNDVQSGTFDAVKGTKLWFLTGKLKPGRSHAYYLVIDGKKSGGRTDVAAYLPESYEQSGVPQGTLHGKFVHTSKLYDGMTSDYWVYVPAQYRPEEPAALMVWQDGEGHTQRNGNARTLNVIDNLIHQKRIPVMIQVFISPGMKGTQRMRSIEYDTVNDTYARFLRDEILAEVGLKWKLRPDGYSRAIAGNSSGGICAFNVAWHQPDQFSRVLSRIGSFTSIQWRPGELEGGNVYPFKVRKEPKRNIRVWLQDGANDLENAHGSWPLQNVQMANSLKYREYDFHLSWGNGTHNGAHGNAEAPEALTWLWRDYDPARTEQAYAMDPAEKDKPMWRVTALNRE